MLTSRRAEPGTTAVQNTRPGGTPEVDAAGTAPRASARVETLDWSHIAAALESQGHARIPALLTAAECRALASLYAEPSRFRSRVIMQRHAYGRGEYQYFDYPLPALVQGLRAALYARLVEIANRWTEQLGESFYPASLDRFLDTCARAGQCKATPLLLRYEAGDYNCLHQDLYGEVAFPLQVAVALSAAGSDYTGGELVLTEQRPHRQSRAEVVLLGLGEGLVFCNRYRPVLGTRGYYRVNMRHGVSTVTSGQRFTLGIIFHDAT